jgi:hypothetical protein
MKAGGLNSVAQDAFLEKPSSGTLKMQSKNETNKKINKNVDIKFSAHHTLLESTSSGTLKVERFE